MNLAVAGVDLESGIECYLHTEAKWKGHLEIFKVQMALKNSGCATMFLVLLAVGAAFVAIA